MHNGNLTNYICCGQKKIFKTVKNRKITCIVNLMKRDIAMKTNFADFTFLSLCFLQNRKHISKEIQIHHKLFLVIAVYCQGSSMNH